MPTQTESGAELIELWFVTSTQMVIDSELFELRIVVPTQMKFYVELIVVSLLTVKSVHFGSSGSLSQHGSINDKLAKFYLAFVYLTAIFLLTN